MTECDLLCRTMLKAQYAMTEGHCSIQLGVWGAVSSLAGPGQSTVGGEAPGSSKNLHFTVPKRGQEMLVWCIFFSVLNTIIKSCQIELTH